MNHSTCTFILFAILYIVSIGASSMERDVSDRSTNNWDYVLYTPNALRHGIQGPAVSTSNKVTIGSVVGQTIYQLDVNKGSFSTLVGQPDGEADDEAFGPDGTLVWTSLLSGLVRSRLTNGTIKVIGQGANVSPNGIAFDSNGNAYYSTFPLPALDGTYGIYKVDPKGIAPQRKVFTLASAMNGFDFSSTNEIYGPYPFTGQIVKVNLATQKETVIASGFLDPEAVRFSADKSTLYVLDIGATAIYSVNIKTGAKTLVVKVPGLVYLDNFRPYSNGLLISDTTSNAPVFYNLQTKTLKYVTPLSVFNLPGGIAFANGKIYIADFTAQKTYNPKNGQLTTIARSGYQGESAPASAVSVSYGLYAVAANTQYLALSCFYDGKVQIRNVNTNAVVVDSITDATAPYTPYGLGFSNDGKTLLIADYSKGLRVNTGAQFQTSRIVTVGDNSVVGIAVSINKANTVYVSTFSGFVYSVNYATGAVKTLASGFNDPEGLTVVNNGGNDVVYAANVGAKTLVRITSNGAKQIVASNLPIGLTAGYPTPNIFTGVAADNYGDVYITSDLNDALIKVGCRS